MAELFGQPWSSSKRKHRAPNVITMINAFNNFCMWVATTIVSQERIKDRVKTFEMFTMIAKVAWLGYQHLLISLSICTA
jgi:hypothetical protein